MVRGWCLGFRGEVKSQANCAERVKAMEQRPRKDRSLLLPATVEKSREALHLPFLLAAAHLVDGGDEEAPMKNMHVPMPNTPN